MFSEAFEFGLYTPEGELISRAELTEGFDPQTQEPQYTLSLEAELPEGDHMASVTVKDEALWDTMIQVPEDFPFIFKFSQP